MPSNSLSQFEHQMRHLLSAAISICIVTAPAFGEDTLERAQTIYQTFLDGELVEFWEDLSPEMQQLFGTVEELKTFREGLSESFGEEVEILDETVDAGPVDTYRRRSRWSQSEAPIGAQLGIASDGSVASFLVRPQPVLADSDFLDYRTKTQLRLPFEGRWFVVWGGRTLEQNYHAADKAQRFAIDVLIYRDGATHSGDPWVLENYYCWDQPILAPASGIVARVATDLPDNPIGSTDPQNPAGNHVVLDFGNGEFAFLGHMRQDSISLQPGDEVKIGQALGVCGNSGNTSEPHLHFHLQTTANLTNGDGLPAYFNEYLADGQMVEQGEPQAGQYIRADP